MAASRRLILDILARDRGAKRTIEGVGDAADDAAADLAGMGSAARRLDADLESTQAQMRGLAAEMAGMDRGTAKFAELRKQFNALSRDASSLSKLRKTFGDLGADGARELSLSFSQRIGPLLARAPISPPLMAAFAGASPAIGAAVGGAVLAGLSAATVGAGIATAFKTPAVKSAGQALATDFKIAMVGATREFVPATLRGISLLRSEVRAIGPDLRAVFAPAARYVEPLVRGFTGLVRGVLPGLATAIAKAGPVVDALGDGLAVIGEQAGKALEAIGDGSAGAAMALRDFLAATAMGIRALGETIGFLSKAYVILKGAVTGDVTLAADFALAQQSADAAAASVGTLTAGLRGVGGAAGTAAQMTRSFNDAQNEAAEAARSAFDAETAFAKAIREAGEAARGASGGISLNTAKGLENRAALSSLAGQIRNSVNAYEEQNGVTRRSVQMQQQGYNAFIRTAQGMGVSRSAARSLARELQLLPPSKTINVRVPGAGGALSTVAALRREMSYLRSREINIRVNYSSTSSGAMGAIGQLGMRAAGGPVKAGRPYIVGEEGPELVVPSRSGTVIPAGETRRMMARGAQTGTPVGSGGVETLVLGGDREIATLIRRLIRTTSGLNVVVG